MTRYDLTVLVSKAEGVEEKIEKVVKALSGKVGRMVEMGKKQLAYPIKKLSEATFLNWTLELEAPAVVQLAKKLTIDREIVRYLLVKAQDVRVRKDKPNVRKKSK